MVAAALVLSSPQENTIGDLFPFAVADSGHSLDQLGAAWLRPRGGAVLTAVPSETGSALSGHQPPENQGQGDQSSAFSFTLGQCSWVLTCPVLSALGCVGAGNRRDLN